MLHYKFYLLDEGGHVLRAQERDLLDDLSALENAQALATEHAVEVWQATRQVVRVGKGGEADFSARQQSQNA